jgi:hypothetical protein
MSPCRILVDLTRALLKDKAELAAENLALRQQLAVQQRLRKRPRLRRRDRVFWVSGCPRSGLVGGPRFWS